MRSRPGARSVRIGLGIVVTAMNAAGCAPAPDRARYTVNEYQKNAQLRAHVLERCAEDPGTLKRLPDCVNAREAERQAGIGSLRSLAPLRLPAKH